MSYCLPNEFHVSPLLVYKEDSMQCSKITEKLGFAIRASFCCFCCFFCFVFAVVLFVFSGGFWCWEEVVWCVGYMFWCVLMFYILCVVFCSIRAV